MDLDYLECLAKNMKMKIKRKKRTERKNKIILLIILEIKKLSSIIP